MEIEELTTALAVRAINADTEALIQEKGDLEKISGHVEEKNTMANEELAEISRKTENYTIDAETRIEKTTETETVKSLAALAQQVPTEMEKAMKVSSITEESTSAIATSASNATMNTKECEENMKSEDYTKKDRGGACILSSVLLIPHQIVNEEKNASVYTPPTSAPVQSPTTVVVQGQSLHSRLSLLAQYDSKELADISRNTENYTTDAETRIEKTTETETVKSLAALAQQVPTKMEKAMQVSSATDENISTVTTGASNVSMDTKKCKEKLEEISGNTEKSITDAETESEIVKNATALAQQVPTQMEETMQITSITEESTSAIATSASNATMNTKECEGNMSEDYTNKDKEGVCILSSVLLIPHETVNEEKSASVYTPPTSAPVQSPNTVVVQAQSLHSSLSLLAQYDSDVESDNVADDADIETLSDTESVVEVPVTGRNNDYRQQVVEIDSNIDSDSDSDSDTDSKSDTEYLTKMRQIIDKSCAAGNENEDDDDEGSHAAERRKKQPPKVKGELMLNELPPIQDLHITVPEEECVELGSVHSIVEQLVLVSSRPDSLLLDLDTVLFLEKGKRVLGEVFDVLGQVADPIYCVRFNSQQQIGERGISIGDVVYVAPKTEHTQFVILSNLIRLRGSDASWENDVEPPPRYLDYSDDEQERAARAKIRGKDRASENDDPSKRTRENEDSDTESLLSVSSVSTSTSTVSTQPYGNGRNRRRVGGMGIGRRGDPYKKPYYPGPRPYYPPGPPRGYDPNFNAGSWHSNYYPPYRGGAPGNYRMLQHTPPHAYYGHPMYTSPPPTAFGPYPQMPPPPFHGPPQQIPTPPGYGSNLYAVSAPVLQPPTNTAETPPPPPPGAQ